MIFEYEFVRFSVKFFLKEAHALRPPKYVTVWLGYLADHVSGKLNVTVWRPPVCLSVCPIGTLTVIHQGAACNASSIYFVLTTRSCDMHFEFVRNICSPVVKVVLKRRRGPAYP